MESVANLIIRCHHHHQLPLTLHNRRPFISKPISSLSFTTSSSSSFPSLKKVSSFSSPIKASFFNSPSPILNPQNTPPVPPFKTTLITVITTAALLLSHLNIKPVFALAPPPPPAKVESKSVSDPEIETGYEADPEEKEKEKEEQESVSNESKSVFSETETEKNLEQKIAANPNDIEALRSLMEIKLKNRNLDEALVLLDKLLILEPNDDDWSILKAYIHTQTGDHEGSKKTFNGIISKDPSRIEAYHGLIMVASQMESEKDLIEAEKKIKGGLEQAKKSKKKSLEREFNVLLAQVLVIKGDYDNALSIYKDLIKEEPKDFRPYLCQGIIYTLLKKDVDAEASFEEYRKLVPKGHPYGEYFEDNMTAAKLFVQNASER